MEITSLKKYKGSTYEAELDGERKIYLHIDIISDFGLRSGMEIDRQRLREVIYASNFRRAYQRALFLLDHRDHSRKELFGKLLAFAQENGLAAVLEGSNLDDDGDWRPGRRAIRELGVRSPLHDAGLTKAEIRALSREMGLPTADKPSFACLASRFPYGERITAEGLARVERAEDWLRSAFPGLAQLRVRSHAGGVARIEVPPADVPRLAARAPDISAALRAFGFAYVSLDLAGYRTGSLNETLPK